MTAVVVGASSGLGRALCEELAARGRDVVIVAGHMEDCARLAAHLRLLHGVKALPIAVDARDPAAFREGLARGLEGVGPVTDLFLPMGAASDEDRIGEAARVLQPVWQVNYAAVVAAVELVRPLMAPGGGRVVGFGSIAAVRARNRNVQYAAAKAALSTYFEGLRHALAPEKCTGQFYVVGYIASGQSFGKTQLFPPMPARRAARSVLNDGARDFGSRFLPRYWALVAAALRCLPWPLFSRMQF
ncbi:MAG: SDR family NAD(P)-dependent oxidoreductase [Allosphingosinicella sp.]|uniref:SDR family NAD(P)-dependent oxidoreductase n=1 Tax=Allosphingosinicella sp. TaxID=2823234 RepID=UPI0039237AF8